ncbi:MAG: AAA family ATPase [Bacillota bacterium]|nr:AAA family ATPase [Bacillota bacterium]
MKILEAEACFGTLRHKRLSFGGGLNVFSMPNEAGKSTWCAFFRAMLYGMPQRERTGASSLAEKERYRPWSGGEDASGTLTILYKERKVVLRRVFSETGKTKEFRAYDAETGIDLKELGADNCGEVLCGVGREAFEKSGFITHNSMSCGNSAEMERKIEALYTSGDEETSAKEAQSRIDRMKNTIRLNKSKGLLPKLEERLFELQKAIEMIRSLASKETLVRSKMLELEEKRAELKSKITSVEEHDAYDGVLKLASAREAAQKLQQEFDAAKKEITCSGRTADRELLSKAWELQAEAREKRAEKRAAGELLLPLQNDRRGAPRKKSAALIAAGILLMLAAALLVLKGVYPLAGVLALAGALPTVFGFVLRKKEKAGAEEKEAKYMEAKKRCETALEDCEASERELEKILLSLGIHADTQEQAADALKALERKVSELDALSHRLAAAKEAEAYLGLRAGSGAEAEKPGGPRPEGSLSEYKRELAELDAEHASVFAEASAISGRIQQSGDLIKLESEQEDAAVKIARLRSVFDSLVLAQETVEASASEISKRVSPVIAKKASEYFSRMTNGKYEKVLVSRGLEELEAAGGDGVMRRILWFSQGTADELYLSLRLALCGLLLKGDGPAPLILDDVLISFDDERLENALNVLREISETRQVILFSCHKRELDRLERNKVL